MLTDAENLSTGFCYLLTISMLRKNNSTVLPVTLIFMIRKSHFTLKNKIPHQSILMRDF